MAPLSLEAPCRGVAARRACRAAMAGALLCLALCAGTGARGVVGVAAAADDNGGAAAASAAPPAVVDEELPPREERRVDDAEIVQAAQFVLEELQELSDSGVYRSLSLGRIHSAASQRGIFHDNIFLDLSLTSPHLNGGAAESRHEVMVMRALEDGVLSFAIDEFPDMDEDAIEAFWIEKVEAHRRFREESFAAIEAEYRQAQQQTAGAAAAEGPSAGDGEL